MQEKSLVWAAGAPSAQLVQNWRSLEVRQQEQPAATVLDTNTEGK